MDFPDINYLAVLVAALAMFVIGAAWYTPLLFAKAWMKELGLKKEDFAKQNMLKTFGGSFLLMLVMSFNLAAFFGPEVDWQAGMIYGALTGIGWVAAAIGRVPPVQMDYLLRKYCSLPYKGSCKLISFRHGIRKAALLDLKNLL